MTKAPHVFVVAYDFPPHGAIGTMRTLRLVRHLDEIGWRITVLTGDPATYVPSTPVEPGLLSRVPPAVRIVRARAWRGLSAVERRLRGASRRVSKPSEATERSVGPRHRVRPGRLRQLKREIDMLLSVPDKENAWIVPAVRAGLRDACASGRPDLLYSSAPPWSGQLVARWLARRWRCPWVADFRDPWARAPWREDRSARVQRLNQRLERMVVARADAIIFVTRGNREEFAGYYGDGAAGRFHVVPNGCDVSEFDGLVPTPEPGRFVLLHAGSLYGGRNPLPLCRVIARLIEERRLDRSTFRLRFLGPVNPAGIDLPAECRALGLDDVVEFPGRVSRAESLRQMVSASALLLLQPGHTVSVPGKVYEYLAAGRPVLAIVEPGEIPDLIRQARVGMSVAPSDEGEMTGALERLIAMAAESVTRPPRHLYDGAAHAAVAARLLQSRLEARRGDAATRSSPSQSHDASGSAWGS